jgi:NAD(P)-dependent dehydrogenase (short-subunit alcohol dehydrogenase family)
MNSESKRPGGRLHGKRSLIVGAGSGIGRAVVQAFLAEGAEVAVLELDAAKCVELEAAAPGMAVMQGNATSAADAQRAIDTCGQLWGGLDVLVNCVGVFDFYRPLGQIETDALGGAFDEVFRANVLSQLAPARAALPLLRASGGSIILTSSSSGFHPGRGGILYVASKFAVRGCVISLAHELAPDVRVNGVAPGGVLGTDLRGAAALGQAQRRVTDGPERVRDLENLTPLKLAMSPADMAGSYVFLASDEACGMTGEFLHPDGGMGVRA